MKMKFLKNRAIATVLSAAALASVLSGCGGGNKFHDATHELGTAGLTVEVFLNQGIKPGKAVFVTDMKSLDLSVPGTHDVTLRYGDREETVKLTIQDTEAPQVTFVTQRTLQPGEELKPEDFVLDTADRAETTVSFARETAVPADYSDMTVEVVVSDANGNTTRGQCQVSFQWMKEELIWEFGREITKGDILVNPDVDGHRLDQAQLDKINASGVGTYTLDIQAGDGKKTCTVTVRDTKGPELNLHFVHIWPQEPVTMHDFIVSVEDPSGVASVELLSELDTLNKGERPVQIKATDKLGNVTVGETFIKVNLDHNAPVIQGMEDITTENGVEPDYVTGVSASDNVDGPIEFTYDASKVNVEEAGVYFVNYTAVDEAGNETVVRRRVIVPPEEADIQKLVDQIAAQLSDDPKDIRNFVWQKIRYSASWGEPHPTWHGFTTWSGNCYVHAFCLKDLLDAKGYETQLIWTTDKSHYWVLVKLEDGWRHMDATPSEQHVRILYMNDWQRHENLDGRNWDRNLWPKAE